MQWSGSTVTLNAEMGQKYCWSDGVRLQVAALAVRHLALPCTLGNHSFLQVVFGKSPAFVSLGRKSGCHCCFKLLGAQRIATENKCGMS